MQLKKIVLISLFSAALGGVLTSCYKTENDSSANNESALPQKTEGMSVLERARLARLERKAALEKKRKEMSEYYTLREEGKYSAVVFFEDEIIDNQSLSVQVPKDYLAVVSKPIEGNNSALDKLTLVNDKEKVSVEVDNTPSFAGVDFSNANFCQSIQSKRTAYSNISVDRTYDLYKNGSSYLCHLHLKDVTTNQAINEIIEVITPEKVVLVKTLSFNNTYMPEEIIKSAFVRIYSPALKDSVRIAIGDFYDTEKFEKIK